MDTNLLLAILVVGLSVFSICHILIAKLPYSQGWIPVCLLVIAITLGLLIFRPGIAGYVGSGLWVLLVLAPSLMNHKVMQLAMAQEYARARKVAAIASLLHPMDGWAETPRMLIALELASQGAFDNASKILQECHTSSTPLSLVAMASLYRWKGEWHEMLEWMDQLAAQSTIPLTPDLVSYKLRALGETGDLDGLLETFDRFNKSLRHPNLRVYRDLCRLYVFAFCGRRDLVARILARRLSAYPQHTKDFWLATADLASGESERAQQVLTRLRSNDDGLLQRSVERRLTCPISQPGEQLDGDVTEILIRAEKDFEHELAYGEPMPHFRRAYATYCLVGINLIVFALEHVRGGTMNPLTLYQMGGVVPSLVIAGEWWRLVAANFLHHGPGHLTMNMLGLLVLGPFVESALGLPRYLFVYMFSGIGALLAVVMLTIAGMVADQLLIGASGAIMGLVGATVSVLLRGWRRERAAIASRRLATICAMIVVQIAFDLSHPRVSFEAHLGGLIFGFVLAAILSR